MFDAKFLFKKLRFEVQSMKFGKNMKSKIHNYSECERSWVGVLNTQSPSKNVLRQQRQKYNFRGS